MLIIAIFTSLDIPLNLFEKLKLKMNADPTIFSQSIHTNFLFVSFSKLGAK